MKQTKKIKAVDIAKALHLSKATVSLALNGQPGVKEAIRERVLNCKKKMEEGSFRQGRSICLLRTRNLTSPYSTGGITETFYLKMIAGMEQELSRHGYQMEIRFFPAEETRQVERLVQELNQNGIAGVLLLATYMEEWRLNSFRSLKIPCVIYDNDFESLQFDQILAHNRGAIRSAVRFLIEQGHKHIAYFWCQDSRMYNIWKRNQAAEQMRLECLGKGIELELIPYESFDVFLKRLGQVRQKEGRITAVVCSNIVVTERLVAALLQMQLRIPGDISLIGIDPAEGRIPESLHLTHFDMRDDYRGSFAIKRLIERIEGNVTEVLTTEIAPTFVRGETVKGAIYYD